MDLWTNRLKAKGDGEAVLNRVLSPAYAEPHRRYHTWRHVHQCLVEMDSVYNCVELRHNHIERINAIEMALWFHDVVYQIGRDDNENKSADTANSIMQEAKLPEQFRLKVCGHIDMTDHRHSHAEVTSGDHGVIVDIDVAVLGGHHWYYDEYRDQIRQEYAEVPDDVFYPGRRRVLERFLARPLVYHTEHFQNQYEAQARRNMVREITEINERLKQHGQS
jgi:predicted metal-dependent HD superfamily phosphohydrolase